MKTLIQMIDRLLARLRIASVEERYLARAVDAHDLELRQFALERERP